jgi:hypothetical protein
MLKNITKYWPVISLIALSVVSMFNIGYFGAIGYHFIGIMDVTNIVYPFGLVFGIIVGAGVMFPGEQIEDLRDFAKHPRAEELVARLLKIAMPFLAGGFAIGLFLPSYISLMGLFSLYFGVVLLITYAMAGLQWLRYDKIHFRTVVFTVFATYLTVSFYGGYKAQSEAYYAKTTYEVVSKSGSFSGVRIVRTSSSGFLIAKPDRTIMFIPAGEVRYIATNGEL